MAFNANEVKTEVDDVFDYKPKNLTMRQKMEQRLVEHFTYLLEKTYESELEDIQVDLIAEYGRLIVEQSFDNLENACLEVGVSLDD